MKEQEEECIYEARLGLACFQEVGGIFFFVALPSRLALRCLCGVALVCVMDWFGFSVIMLKASQEGDSDTNSVALSFEPELDTEVIAPSVSASFSCMGLCRRKEYGVGLLT